MKQDIVQSFAPDIERAAIHVRCEGEVGLGLSIVKSNMEHLGCPYGVRNLPEEGMIEFYIRLPLAAPEGEGTL